MDKKSLENNYKLRKHAGYSQEKLLEVLDVIISIELNHGSIDRRIK